MKLAVVPVKKRNSLAEFRAGLQQAAQYAMGVVVLFATIIAYGCAGALLLCACFKPIFPSAVGVWLAPQRMVVLGWSGNQFDGHIYGLSVRSASFVIGSIRTHGPLRDLVGFWIIPIAAILAASFMIVATVLEKWLVFEFVHRKAKPADHPRKWPLDETNGTPEFWDLRRVPSGK